MKIWQVFTTEYASMRLVLKINKQRDKDSLMGRERERKRETETERERERERQTDRQIF